jgi:hypothetical protein
MRTSVGEHRPPESDDDDEDRTEAKGGFAGSFDGSIDKARWTISFRAGVVLAGLAVVWVARMLIQIIHELMELINIHSGLRK